MLILYAKSENSTPINENFKIFGSHFGKWPLRPNRAKSRMAPLLILISMMNITCIPNFILVLKSAQLFHLTALLHVAVAHAEPCKFGS